NNLCPQATTAFILELRADTRSYKELKAGSFERPAIPPLEIRDVFRYLFPWVVCELFCFPALSLEPGETPAQEAKCPTVLKASTFGPISPKITAALCFLIPGISISSSYSSGKCSKT